MEGIRKRLAQYEQRNSAEAKEIVDSARLSEIPPNVTKLQSPDTNATVYLIGTAHVSRNSAEDVRKLIRLVQPQTVVIELCRSRLDVLVTTENTEAFSKPLTWEDIRSILFGPTVKASATTSSPPTIAGNTSTTPSHTTNNATAAPSPSAQNNQLQATNNPSAPAPQPSSQSATVTRPTKPHQDVGSRILHLLFVLLYRRVIAQLKVVPGAEFRAAAQEAQLIGARVILGDRPVDITLQRAWAKLGLFSKIKFVITIFRSFSSIRDLQEADIDKIAQSGDLIADALAEISAQFPALYEALVAERDVYLATYLRRCPGQVVVGVVGAGHLEGIRRNWETPLPDLSTLLVVPQQTRWDRIRWKAVKYSSIALILLVIMLGVYTILWLVSFVASLF